MIQLLEETLKFSVRLCFRHWEVISNNNCPSCTRLELARLWGIIGPPCKPASSVFCVAVFIWFFFFGKVGWGMWRKKSREQRLARVLIPEYSVIGFVRLIYETSPFWVLFMSWLMNFWNTLGNRFCHYWSYLTEKETSSDRLLANVTQNSHRGPCHRQFFFPAECVVSHGSLLLSEFLSC